MRAPSRNSSGSRTRWEITSEWQHTRTTFGETFHDAGNKLLQIAKTVHASPQRYEGLPYLELSRSHDFSDYHQFFRSPTVIGCTSLLPMSRN
jgi:hypothetical protein